MLSAEILKVGSGDVGKKYPGGETAALELLHLRVQLEEKTFAKNEFMPNQTVPDLMGKPMSMSPYLRFGCISVHRMFWMIRDTYCKVNSAEVAPTYLTSQLIWREFFYTMSATNPMYNRMKGNPICLQIDWYDDDESYQKWVQGKTGFPWIDAIMIQLHKEGWIHQVCRHAVSSFLTRGDLWISWEKGFDTFEKHLLDADWSVCAGNWMWLSSSAFEKFLQCPNCFCPVRYGRRMDPSGEYIKSFLPVLKNMPLKYLFEPWKAPLKVQEEAKCIVGKDYPKPMVKHSDVSKRNKKHMNDVMQVFKDIVVNHCAPSSEQEVYDLTWLPEIDLERPTKCTADEFCTKVH
ncbi:cryptochrome-1-like [Anneissia japonica]|uniref:cryptochrome-1-like n=1 Tax=Anneissia japonica TaxID=1529436 RepID=UPI001425BB74|nr:cryptochrome-1-like [Anneissia japonica]